MGISEFTMMTVMAMVIMAMMTAIITAGMVWWCDRDTISSNPYHRIESISSNQSSNRIIKSNHRINRVDVRLFIISIHIIIYHHNHHISSSYLFTFDSYIYIYSKTIFILFIPSYIYSYSIHLIHLMILILFDLSCHLVTFDSFYSFFFIRSSSIHILINSFSYIHIYHIHVSILRFLLHFYSFHHISSMVVGWWWGILVPIPSSIKSCFNLVLSCDVISEG